MSRLLKLKSPILYLLRLFLIAFVALNLTACSDGVLFDEIISLDPHGWKGKDKVGFRAEVKDTAQIYSFKIHIRNAEDYRYSNLYVFMQTRFPNGNITHDTLECVLADPFGKWYGKSSGRYSDHSIVLNPVIKFPLVGTYDFELEQAMRDEPLEGIHAVGIRIEQLAY